MKQMHLSKYAKFKIKNFKFNYEILLFVKFAFIYNIDSNNLEDIFRTKSIKIEMQALKILK